MDTLDAVKIETGQQGISVEDKLAVIKREMPMTYAAIQEWASRIGNKAFEQVRRGLRGQYRCFYAYEAGHVVGTYWSVWSDDYASEWAVRLDRFGSPWVSVQLGMGESHGTH